MSPRQSLLYRAQTGLCIRCDLPRRISTSCCRPHYVTDYKNRYLCHTDIISYSVCVSHVGILHTDTYSWLVFPSNLPPHSLPLLSSTAKVGHSKSLSLSLSLSLPPPPPSRPPKNHRCRGRPCRWLSLFYSLPDFCPYANFLQIS